MITHREKKCKDGLICWGLIFIRIFAVIFNKGPICALGQHEVSHIWTTTQILMSTVSWQGIFHLLHSLPDVLLTSFSFGSLTWCQTVPGKLPGPAWSNGHQCEPFVWKRLLVQRESPRREIALDMIAAATAVVTGSAWCAMAWPQSSVAPPSAISHPFRLSLCCSTPNKGLYVWVCA